MEDQESLQNPVKNQQKLVNLGGNLQPQPGALELQLTPEAKGDVIKESEVEEAGSESDGDGHPKLSGHWKLVDPGLVEEVENSSGSDSDSKVVLFETVNPDGVVKEIR